jgi:hypothetical protein
MPTRAGRKSGLLSHSVVEIARYDQATGTYYVVFSEKAGWFRNICRKPRT